MDSLQRGGARGRRGLDVLNKLRNNSKVDLKIVDAETREMEGQPVDMKLLLLAKHLLGTRIAHEIFGLDDRYAFVLLVNWPL